MKPLVEMDVPYLFKEAFFAFILCELRSDYAGETGVFFIFQGVLAIARGPAVRTFFEGHLVEESQHQLVYYDVASNWSSWQYLAGVGMDLRGKRHFDIDKKRRFMIWITGLLKSGVAKRILLIWAPSIRRSG
jgi:hypothetical protein